jgi:hypothetical protein
MRLGGNTLRGSNPRSSADDPRQSCGAPHRPARCRGSRLRCRPVLAATRVAGVCRGFVAACAGVRGRALSSLDVAATRPSLKGTLDCSRPLGDRPVRRIFISRDTAACTEVSGAPCALGESRAYRAEATTATPSLRHDRHQGSGCLTRVGIRNHVTPAELSCYFKLYG